MNAAKWIVRGLLAAAIFAGSQCGASAQGKRKVIIDQDCAGPGGTDMQAVLALINSPQTEVLGITVLTGDAWRDEEVQHTLRLLEIIGRTDIPVVPGAIFPLVNRERGISPRAIRCMGLTILRRCRRARRR
jgi:purine nucleosidase